MKKCFLSVLVILLCMFSVATDLNSDNTQPISVFDKIENINKDNQQKNENGKIKVVERKLNRIKPLPLPVPVASNLVIPTKDTEISEMLFKLSDLESAVDVVKNKNQEYENNFKAYLLNSDSKKGNSFFIAILAIIIDILLLAVIGYLVIMLLVLKRKVNNIQLELGSSDTPLKPEKVATIEPVKPDTPEPIKEAICSYLFPYIDKSNADSFVKQVEKWNQQSLYGVISKTELYSRIAIVLANISAQNLDIIWANLENKKEILILLTESADIPLTKIYDLNKTLLEDLNTVVDSGTLLKKIWNSFSAKVKEELYEELSEDEKQKFNRVLT